jgi:hypothetical protein
MARNEPLRRQLEAILETLPGQSTNTHWKVGQSLNGIRDVLLDAAPTEDKKLFETVFLPLSIRESGPYSLETQDVERLCRQLLAYLAG